MKKINFLHQVGVTVNTFLDINQFTWKSRGLAVSTSLLKFREISARTNYYFPNKGKKTNYHGIALNNVSELFNLKRNHRTCLSRSFSSPKISERNNYYSWKRVGEAKLSSFLIDVIHALNTTLVKFTSEKYLYKSHFYQKLN